jgi:biotin transporter BioY
MMAGSDLDQRRIVLFAAVMMGVLVILVTGVIGLYININWIAHARLTWSRAIWTGAILFLPVETLKAIVAAELIHRIRPVLVRMRSQA